MSLHHGSFLTPGEDTYLFWHTYMVIAHLFVLIVVYQFKVFLRRSPAYVFVLLLNLFLVLSCWLGPENTDESNSGDP